LSGTVHLSFMEEFDVQHEAMQFVDRLVAEGVTGVCIADYATAEDYRAIGGAPGVSFEVRQEFLGMVLNLLNAVRLSHSVVTLAKETFFPWLEGKKMRNTVAARARCALEHAAADGSWSQGQVFRGSPLEVWVRRDGVGLVLSSGKREAVALVIAEMKAEWLLFLLPVHNGKGALSIKQWIVGSIFTKCCGKAEGFGRKTQASVTSQRVSMTKIATVFDLLRIRTGRVAPFDNGFYATDFEDDLYAFFLDSVRDPWEAEQVKKRNFSFGEAKVLFAAMEETLDPINNISEFLSLGLDELIEEVSPGRKRTCEFAVPPYLDGRTLSIREQIASLGGEVHAKHPFIEVLTHLAAQVGPQNLQVSLAHRCGEDLTRFTTFTHRDFDEIPLLAYRLLREMKADASVVGVSVARVEQGVRHARTGLPYKTLAAFSFYAEIQCWLEVPCQEVRMGLLPNPEAPNATPPEDAIYSLISEMLPGIALVGRWGSLTGE
jgi:hypothetical protein